jgi:c-di-GMP-binding flagellar brake protein YcgR
VRVRPLPDLPAEIRVAAQPPGISLMIADISLGGVGIWVKRGDGPKAGERVSLRMRLDKTDVAVDAEVRHVTPDGSLCGVEFVDVSEDAHDAISEYVSELTERGSVT